MQAVAIVALIVVGHLSVIWLLGRRSILCNRKPDKCWTRLLFGLPVFSLPKMSGLLLDAKSLYSALSHGDCVGMPVLLPMLLPDGA